MMPLPARPLGGMNRDVKPYQKTSFGDETGMPRQISKRVSILHVPEYP
jgi:hypothetical protein